MVEKLTPISGTRFWREFHTAGCVYADMGEAIATHLDEPRAWIDHILGRVPNYVRAENFKRPKADGTHYENVSATFFTSPSTHFPPHLQIFVVLPGSNAKLVLHLLDSWLLLQEAEKRSADFYLNLFNRIRIMRYEKAAFIAPTFSTINDRLIFTQPPKIGEKDKIGERVKNWVSNRDPFEVEVFPGEILVIDNHRYAKKICEQSILDGVESYSVWTEQITNIPNNQHLALANEFKTKLASIFPVTDEKILMRFGLGGKSLDQYIRASLDTPTRLEELMPIFKQIFEELNVA